MALRAVGTRVALRLGLFALALLLAPAGGAAEGVTLRWLGVAGFTVSDGETTLAFDPFFTRPGVLATLFGDYDPDPEVLAPLLEADGPAPELARARAIFIGHSHYDHLGDAPWIAQRTGALLVGSDTSLNIARGYGLPAEQGRRLGWGESLELGGFRVTAVESRHARVLFGDVPLPGEVSEPLEERIHAFSFRLGDARAWLVEHRPSGWRALVLSSAGVHRPALEAVERDGGPVDVVLAATQGADADYIPALLEVLRPKLLIPHHFESFFEPLDSPDAATPSDPEALEAFEAGVFDAARRQGHALSVVRLGLFEALALDPPGRQR